ALFSFVALCAALPGVMGCSNTSNNASGPILGTAGIGGGTMALDAGGTAGAGGSDGTPRDASPEAPVQASGYLWYAGSALNAFTKSQTEASNANGPRYVFVPAFSVTNL